jgi:hypothetical protein
LPELRATDTVTFAGGCCESERPTVAELPWSTCRVLALAVTAAAGGGAVDPVGVQVTEAGAVLVPL